MKQIENIQAAALDAQKLKEKDALKQNEIKNSSEGGKNAEMSKSLKEQTRKLFEGNEETKKEKVLRDTLKKNGIEDFKKMTPEDVLKAIQANPLIQNDLNQLGMSVQDVKLILERAQDEDTNLIQEDSNTGGSQPTGGGMSAMSTGVEEIGYSAEAREGIEVSKEAKIAEWTRMVDTLEKNVNDLRGALQNIG